MKFQDIQKYWDLIFPTLYKYPVPEDEENRVEENEPEGYEPDIDATDPSRER